MCDHFPWFLRVEITHMLLWVVFQVENAFSHLVYELQSESRYQPHYV